MFFYQIKTEDFTTTATDYSLNVCSLDFRESLKQVHVSLHHGLLDVLSPLRASRVRVFIRIRWYCDTYIHTYVQHVVQQMLYVRAAGVTRETRTEPSFSFLVLAKAKA